MGYMRAVFPIMSGQQNLVQHSCASHITNSPVQKLSDLYYRNSRGIVAQTSTICNFRPSFLAMTTLENVHVL